MRIAYQQLVSLPPDPPPGGVPILGVLPILGGQVDYDE